MPGHRPVPPDPAQPLGPQVPGTTTLVYGSYHPVPGPAAAVTRAEVLDAWARGEVVTVVSPRPSAAHLAVRIAGPLAARRLARVAVRTGASELVLCAEPGVPLPLEGPRPVARVAQVLTARLLARSLVTFDRVTIVVTGDLGVPRWVLAPLVAVADEVRPAMPPTPAAGPAGGAVAQLGGGPVSALGPVETPWQLRARLLAGRVARRAFGSRAPAVRAGLAGGLRAARRARAALPGRR